MKMTTGDGKNNTVRRIHLCADLQTVYMDSQSHAAPQDFMAKRHIHFKFFTQYFIQNKLIKCGNFQK